MSDPARNNGEKLRLLRRLHRASQSEIAEAIGVTRPVVAAWETQRGEAMTDEQFEDAQQYLDGFAEEGANRKYAVSALGRFFWYTAPDDQPTATHLWLAARIAESGLTDDSLAQMVGINPGSVRDIRTLRRAPGLQTEVRLSVALQVWPYPPWSWLSDTIKLMLAATVAGRTKAEMADILGIKKCTFSGRLGRDGLKSHEIWKLCDSFNIPLQWISSYHQPDLMALSPAQWADSDGDTEWEDD